MSKFDLDIEAVEKLANLLSETGLSEIEYEEGDKRIRCVKHEAQVQMVAAAPLAPIAPQAQTVAPETPALSGTPVTAPMVGTVYMAPEPGAAPFIKVGDRIKEGETLLIIEAMKVMNPIKAPQSGEIKEIFVSDTKPVEFGEILLTIA
ncbi:MAG: acetyl-CoA carboxylase biotin carboxyl carrier protein [Bdellovibrionales bacterium]